MRIKLLVGSAVIIAALFPIASPAQTSKKASTGKKNETPKTRKESRADKAVARGRRVFGTHCASCHMSGGNSVVPGKPVKGSQVLSTLATFKSYLNEPIGNMPHYEHLITDEKLLADLYSYVKDLDRADSPTTDEGNKSDGKKRKT